MLSNFLLPCTVVLMIIVDSSCTQLRSCPLGLYCPGGYNCKDSSECVYSCYVINATHQGNGTTGRCEDVSVNSDVWLDSSLYEVFVYRKLNQNEILKSISLIATYGFWNNVANGSEDVSSNITFNLTSSIHLTLEFDTFEGFQNENTPQIVRRSSIISPSAQDLTLGDYSMKIQAIWQDIKLAESDVIIHVVDPPPTPLPVPVACVEFSSDNYSVSSLDLSLKVTLTLTGRAQTEPFNVFVIAKDTLSADSAEDFTPGWYRATFEPGATHATANEIPISSKSLDESIEQFSLELYIPSASYIIGIQHGILRKATANIKDETEVFAMIGEDMNVPENVYLTISCSHLIDELVPFNIAWSIEGNEASNGSAPNVIISQNKHQLIVTRTLLSVGGQLGSSGTYACTVCSNNGTCLKRQSYCEICETPRLAKAPSPITHLSSSDTASFNCEENLCIGPKLPSFVFFTCGVKSGVNYEINVYRDNLFYSTTVPSVFDETMIPNSLGTYKVVMNNSCGMDTATSVLSLCEMMIVYFDATVFAGSESSGSITVSLELIRNSSFMNGNISVLVIPSNQSPLSAEGGGVDHNSTSVSATFPAGINSTTVNIPVISDNIVEKNETLQLEIYVPVPAKYAVKTGKPSKAIAIITDSSTSSINFHQPVYSINENNGTVQVELVLSNPVSFDFTVIINDLDESAVGSVDYNAGPYNIMIPAGETRVLFNVTIIDDNIYEGHEQFVLTMPTTQSLPDGIYFGNNLAARISIEDNDALTVSFDHPTYQFNKENEVARPLLILSNPSSTDITIKINTISNTAVGNVDYIPGPYNVTFPAGETTIHLDISLLNNNETTHAEFLLEIVHSSEVALGDNSQATVTLISRDAIYCDEISDIYFGVSVTWERTLPGVMAQHKCTGDELTGTINRTCDTDGEWLPAIVACIRQSFINVNDKLETIQNSSSPEEKLAGTDTIAMVLANITTPLNESYFPNELSIAVNVLSEVNTITDRIIESRHPNDTFFKDTAKVLNNLLSSSNEAGWQDLQKTSREVNQMLIQSSEDFGKILAQTLNNETSKLLETQENIVIKTELTTQQSINEGSSISFPDDGDDLTMFAGHTTRIVLPNDLLKLALSNLSSDATAVPIVNMVFRDLSLILPNSSNASDPVTSVISTQLPYPVSSSDGDPIVLTFEVINKDGNSDTRQLIKQCVFYDYELRTNDGSTVGGWSTRGVNIKDDLSNDTIITCYSTHLTSFAVLVSPQDERPPTKEDKALSIVSYVGCAISLVFLTISIIILFIIIRGKPAKKRNPILIHLNLCIALALGLIVFISGIETAVDNEVACKFVAALLQYLFTSAFCWMLCEGVMLYMMLITVFGNKLNNCLFFLALGWGPAIPIVAISVGLAHEHYGTDHYCWIKSDDGSIAAFIAPIGTIILINCVFFLMTLRVIYRNRSGNTNESFDRTAAKEILKAAMFLLPLLGLTWLIGILAVNNETQVFAWIFAILNSLQGFFLFIFHIARNKEVIAKFHVAKERYIFGNEGSSFYNRIYGSKRTSSSSTYSKSTRESRSSASEMLPTQSIRKGSTYSTDDDVFSSNALKNVPDTSVIHEEPAKQVKDTNVTLEESTKQVEVNDSNKGQDVIVTYNKEEEVKILDNSNESSEKHEVNNEKEATTDSTNKS